LITLTLSIFKKKSIEKNTPSYEHMLTFFA